MNNFNQSMQGAMTGYTGQYDAETRRQQAIDDYWIRWNTGEVNKNLAGTGAEPAGGAPVGGGPSPLEQVAA